MSNEAKERKGACASPEVCVHEVDPCFRGYFLQDGARRVFRTSGAMYRDTAAILFSEKEDPRPWGFWKRSLGWVVVIFILLPFFLVMFIVDALRSSHGVQ